MNDDSTSTNTTPDDALEVTRQSDPMNNMDPPLPEDGGTPAAPASDPADPLPSDHPAHDNGTDVQELYDEGLTTGTGITDQHESNEESGTGTS